MRKQGELDKIKSAIESIDLSIQGYEGLLKNEDNVNEFSNYEEQIRLLNVQKKGLESNFRQICETEMALIEEEIQARENLLKTLEKRGNEGNEQKKEIASLKEELAEIQTSLKQMGLTSPKVAENEESKKIEETQEELQEKPQNMEQQIQDQDHDQEQEQKREHKEPVRQETETAKPMKSEQNTSRIKKIFQTLIAKFKQIIMAKQKVNGELEKRNLKEKNEKGDGDVKLEETSQQIEQSAEPEIVPQKAVAKTLKEKLTTKFKRLLGMYAKTSWNLTKVNAQVEARKLKENVKNSKLVQGVKNAATITVGGVVATGEAIRNANSTVQKARKEKIQHIVSAGKVKTEDLLGKLEDSVYTKEARIAELQNDLQQGREQPKVENELGFEPEFA